MASKKRCQSGTESTKGKWRGVRNACESAQNIVEEIYIRNLIFLICFAIIISDKVVMMNAKALSIMRYQDDINTEHNMKSTCRAVVA